MSNPKIVVTCGWRYEPEWLVEEMKENLSWAYDFAILDDRDREELWINEYEYRLKTRELAISKGAEWILVTSPDERFEKDAEQKIMAGIMKNQGRGDVMFQFDLREMFSPTAYRVDGIWGKKKRIRLYPVRPEQQYLNKRIQTHPFPIGNDGAPLYPIIDLGVNIYHLKMIEPGNRTERTKVFKALDPYRQFQQIGYDYLDNEIGMQLATIKRGREYSPPYRKYIFKAGDTPLDKLKKISGIATAKKNKDKINEIIGIMKND